MEISSFDDLLRAAHVQSEPQRLLFVFTAAELPDESSVEQRRRFDAGEGGALVPMMYVDKEPAELQDFGALAQEAVAFGQEWRIVFAAALSGRAGIAPTSSDAEAPLQRMVEAIRQGTHDAFMPFDRQGQPVRFD